ncbi:MAG: hypothetical protein Q8Q11_02210 [bacterium]|nr:hypothetical protein [bacterium]MDZ4248000.1 hypothetical protein [Patescibacteria group bacterium]
MQVLTHSTRILGTLLVLGAALLTTGCLNRTPDQSGVSVSDDAGNSWEAAPDLQAENGNRPDVFPPMATTAVAAAPSKPDRIFTGTEDDLYVTSDAGKGWRQITDRLPDAAAVDVQDIAILSSEPNVVLVAGVSNGYGKVFRSVDGGRSFKAVFTTAEPKQPVNTVAFGQGRTIFAGDQTGNLFRSRDRGDSWQRVFSTESAISALAVSGRNLFVGTFGRGVFRSADAGNSFASASDGLQGQGVTVWSLAVGGGELYAGTQQGLFRTTDFGRSWREVNGPDAVRGALIQSVAVGGDTVYFASNAVVYRLSSDGTRFVPRQIDLAQSVSDIAPVSSARVYVSASSENLEQAGLFRNNLPVLQGVPAPAQ